MDPKEYQSELEKLQIELAKLQYWVQTSAHASWCCSRDATRRERAG